MKDMKVRLPEEKAEDIKLWLASGTVRISFTGLMVALMEAFHDEITDKECTIDTVAESIRDSVKIGRATVEARRAGYE